MNLPSGETNRSLDLSPDADTFAEIPTSIEYRIEPLPPNAREITVWTQTTDFCCNATTTIYVTEGTGRLITRSKDCSTSGARIIEPGATAKLRIGTTYCYYADKMLKVLEHRESPSLGCEDPSLLQ